MNLRSHRRLRIAQAVYLYNKSFTVELRWTQLRSTSQNAGNPLYSQNSPCKSVRGLFAGLKLLGKFTTGSFLYEPRKGLVGLISEQSSFERLVVDWLDGKKQTISLRPSGRDEQQLLNRIQRLRNLHLRDFDVEANVPTRLLKVTRGQDCIQAVTLSLLLPGKALDVEQLAHSLVSKVTGSIRAVTAADYSSFTLGQTARTRVRIFL